MRRFVFGLAALLASLPILGADPAPAPLGPDRLATEIAALLPEQPARQALPWRTCLRAAIGDAKAAKKPLLIWAFRGEPGEGRC